jgi:hypothetical protein
MWAQNLNSKYQLESGKIVSRRSRRCPKHVQRSDLANRLIKVRL